MNKFDFGGWATKHGIKCADGRTIIKDAFKSDDGVTVPLVWNHQHNDSSNVLGHALLEARKDGVYAYCSFNDTDSGRNAKMLVEHGDISALSIRANQLVQQGLDVIHGVIREVSLVLAGANPGALIDSIIKHGEESDDEAIVYNDSEGLLLSHAEEGENNMKKQETDDSKKSVENQEKESGKTVKDVWDTLTEEQKTIVYAMIGEALDNTSSDKNDEGGDKNMKHNLFDNDYKDNAEVLTHSEIAEIISDGKRYGSLKASVLEHGIENIDYLFPEAKTINNTPDFISRDMTWVQKIMNGVHNTPFSRIKSIHADITEDDARAKGYMKGNLKKDEVFSLLKRTTSPTTIYKKQKIDRDDVVDIVDFDVISWLKTEMRMMLNEEIARAVLVGDGRLSSSDDKINEQNIRPIWKDSELYTIKSKVEVAAGANADTKAKAFIRTCIKSRKNYKGSGEPTLYTNDDVLTDCLLLEDNNGRVIYDSVQKLATALRVKEIVVVPVMENLSRVDETTSDELSLMGIMVNLKDYNVGADKGGSVNMFDDFDIDYNAQKYLIETRCSGALTKPLSAIAIELVETSTEG